MGIRSWLTGQDIELAQPQVSQRSDVDWYLNLLAGSMGYGGVGYPFLLQQTHTTPNEEEPGDFEGYTAALFKNNAVIFGLMEMRRRLFCQARFAWQQTVDGRPTKMFGSSTLGLLENPWPNGYTSDMLGRMLQDADLGGNAFVARVAADRLFRLRPDWTTIIAGSTRADAEIGDPDVEVVGFLYQPGGLRGGRRAVRFLVEQVAHFAPTPDPEANWRGMSWLTPVLREVMSDNASTTHKRTFFDNGATPNMIVKLDIKDRKRFMESAEMFRDQHEGAQNAYKTLFLGAGMDATVVGTNFQQMDFTNVQGAGEVRMALAAGVHPVMAGILKGLDASTFTNFSQARRLLSDVTLRPLWHAAAESLQPVVDFPPNASRSTVRLWYDDRDVPFLQDDMTDRAKVQAEQAATINTLITAGYKADSALTAVTSGDFASLLGQHTGMTSVQLQKPGASASTNGASASTNGAGGNGTPQPAQN